ncbi:MAG: hypothetical protein QW260_08235 [Thermoproteota archaeon]
MESNMGTVLDERYQSKEWHDPTFITSDPVTVIIKKTEEIQ